MTVRKDILDVRDLLGQLDEKVKSIEETVYGQTPDDKSKDRRKQMTIRLDEIKERLSANANDFDGIIANLLELAEKSQPTNLCGHTEEEWQRIIELGTLCEFSHDGKIWSIPRRLTSFDCTMTYSKYKSGTGAFRHCRISITPGHLRPCFGERPEDIDDGDYIVTLALPAMLAIKAHWPTIDSFMVWPL